MVAWVCAGLAQEEQEGKGHGHSSSRCKYLGPGRERPLRPACPVCFPPAGAGRPAWVLRSKCRVAVLRPRARGALGGSCRGPGRAWEGGLAAEAK